MNVTIDLSRKLYILHRRVVSMESIYIRAYNLFVYS